MLTLFLAGLSHQSRQVQSIHRKPSFFCAGISLQQGLLKNAVIAMDGIIFDLTCEKRFSADEHGSGEQRAVGDLIYLVIFIASRFLIALDKIG